MFAILRGANGRRHEVDFADDSVVVDIAMSDETVQLTITAAEDMDPNRRRFATMTLPREAFTAALAVASRGRDRDTAEAWRPRLVTSK